MAKAPTNATLQKQIEGMSNTISSKQKTIQKMDSEIAKLKKEKRRLELQLEMAIGNIETEREISKRYRHERDIFAKMIHAVLSGIF